MAASGSRRQPMRATLLRASALFLCFIASATAIQLPKMSQLPERAEMWRSAVARRAAKVKIAPPPVFQPGQVAVGGSAIFMGAGVLIGSPSRIAAGLATALIVSGPVQILVSLPILPCSHSRRGASGSEKNGINVCRPPGWSAYVAFPSIAVPHSRRSCTHTLRKHGPIPSPPRSKYPCAVCSDC